MRTTAEARAIAITDAPGINAFKIKGGRIPGQDIELPCLCIRETYRLVFLLKFSKRRGFTLQIFDKSDFQSLGLRVAQRF